MFIGHFGVALAAKRFAPRTSLGTLFLAAEFADLLWPILLLTGVEHVRLVPGLMKMSAFDFYDYPLSHSLLLDAIWAVVAGGIYYAARRYRQGAWAVAWLVLSHWWLDLMVHRPDLPLWPGGLRLGLGLWNHPAAEITLEVAIFAAGIWMYGKTARARDAAGRYGFLALMALLFLGWASTLFAGAPPDVKSVAVGALSMWITLPWAWWVDKHRDAL